MLDYTDRMLCVRKQYGPRELGTFKDDEQTATVILDILDNDIWSHDIEHDLCCHFNNKNDIDLTNMNGEETGIELSLEKISKFILDWNTAFVQSFLLEEECIPLLFETALWLQDQIVEETQSNKAIVHTHIYKLFMKPLVTLTDYINLVEELPLYFKIMHLIHHAIVVL